MTAHQLLPLLALALNICLGAVSLARDPGSRLHRVFAYFAGAQAVWNFGVFMLRRSPDPDSAYFWELVIHAGVVVLPAFYYHFVLILLDSTVVRRAALVAAYAAAAAFVVLNAAGTPAFMRGVTLTPWGWAPAVGPLYHVFLLYFHAVFVAGLIHLACAYRTTASGFRRSRLKLVLLGSAITISGGVIDIARFALAPALPWVGRLYPVGIPANMACALLFGVAIVRYRMFDVSALVRRTTVSASVSAMATGALVLATWAFEEAFALRTESAVWILAPVGLALGLFLTPVGRPVVDRIEHLMFSRPHGCHDTLVQLSRRFNGLLASDRVVDTLVTGLVRGVPVTHAALLLEDSEEEAFVLRREESASGERVGLGRLPRTSAVAEWLAAAEGILVKEEVRLNRRLARALEGAGEELDQVRAALLVPLKIEGRLTGILLLGEKLSGDIYDARELELLAVLAQQAAVALHNARLYERAERERRRTEALYVLARRLASVPDADETLRLIVHEAARLLETDFAALRLVEGEEIVLRVCTEPALSALHRARLRVGESLTGRVIAANRPLAVADVAADDRYDSSHREAARALGVRAFLGVPVRAAESAPLGVLYVYSRRRRRFDPDDVSLLGALADQIAVTLTQSRLSAERRQAEEALRQSEKLATMGQLLAGVAHELNNPLTVILGFAGLLGPRLAGTDLEGPSRQIAAAAERCARIVGNFLALARKRSLERKRVALNEVVTSAVELLGYPLKVDAITVETDLEGDLPILWADPHQLQQVLVNLLTNAHHALRQSPVRRLTISTRHDPAARRLVLRVADTGPGIPPEVQARIFEPFFTTKPVGEGTGLGLSLCQSIVESHGGTIRVASAPGAGAVFTVELPVDAAEHAASSPAAASPGPVLPGRRVLVVDDEPGVAEALQNLLHGDGHRAETAADGLVALMMLERGAYDMVISDIRMPGLDGPTLYGEVVRRQPGRPPAFVFMTGDLLGTETRDFLERSGLPCLRKPFTLEDVRRALALALDGVQAAG
ncbi:MAG TPA: GAF domain-containing protein [Candidatus Binatia bacterium]|nr:GAF domain-containing protein [Candidatus Binatia bacterium]